MSGYSLFRGIRESDEAAARHLVQTPSAYGRSAQHEIQLPDGEGMHQMLSGESEFR
jgi:hypothetical protein